MGTTPTEQKYPLDELRIGRVFVHGTMSNPLDARALYCRIVAWDDERVHFDIVHHNDDGTERLDRWGMVHAVFWTSTLGHWDDSDEVPAARRRSRGIELPMTAKKDGQSGPPR